MSYFFSLLMLCLLSNAHAAIAKRASVIDVAKFSDTITHLLNISQGYFFARRRTSLKSFVTNIEIAETSIKCY